jgi:predicted MFS family arabinose efflux permease
MRTLKIIFALGVFMVFDAFAGGLTPNSYYSLWFTKQWNASPELIGLVLMICSIISGIGGFLASQSVKYIGIIAVMIGSHLPSNLFLILIPLMPTLQLSIIMTILKSFTTNMNLSCRQTYIM